MKLYKDMHNEVFVIPEGQEHLVSHDWIEITQTEREALINKQGSKTVSPERIEQIKARLDLIDFESIRPLRAIITNTANLFDHKKLHALNNERNELMFELSVQRY
ncbi:hypothetical protein [Thiomicrorhabdus xiamenensis]|uniref:Uncharacterized protein n=1 Tax=Thiomicrorhabdus xiamenensis TaxID=2739063 RepID=A0A7D4SMU1_9GAMM|nr:hypothetical protein [Thiomicrorhabdus xiamenensis]QKI88941.1 hypothetical protein HQN79_04830 [Thiomicrorhabdus xiamenensis]